MKTLLHVIDTTGPGGAETVFIELISRLPKQHYQPVIVIRGKGWVYDELVRRGFEPLIMNAKGSLNWRFLLSLCRLIRKKQIDLVQSHLLGSNVYCSLAGLLTHVPVVATFHGAVDISRQERLKWLKIQTIIAGSGRVIAVTESLRDELLERTQFKPAQIAVIRNGIDTMSFRRPRSARLRAESGWDDEVLIIGSLGNIRTAKGYHILLQAAAKLRKTHSNFRFVIAGQGKGQLYDDLLRLRESLKLEDVVIFLGFIDDPADFLANIDLFLSSSISEGLPLSAIQAMVAGLPIVATRCGGYERLITDGDNGCLVSAGDADALAMGIEKVATDRALQQHLGENARALAEASFDISVMLDGYQRIYAELLDDGAAGVGSKNLD